MKHNWSDEAFTPSVLLLLNFTPQCCYKEVWLCHTVEVTVTTQQSDYCTVRCSWTWVHTGDKLLLDLV